MATIEFNGTGGIMEGDFGTNDININLDAIYSTVGSEGSGNYISATHTVPATGDFSMSFWMRNDAPSSASYNYPIGNGGGGGGRSTDGVAGGKGQLLVFENSYTQDL